MLRRLFSAEPLTAPGTVVRLDPHESHHARHVLRLKTGARVAVFDGAGRQFAATVERFERRRLAIVLDKPLPGPPETPIPVVLYLAVTKGAAFHSALQRAVELGAAEIIPFAAERSVATVRAGAGLDRKMERWRQILLAATKQSGRNRLTPIVPPCSFESAVQRPDPRAIRLCCAPDPHTPRLSEVLRAAKPSAAQSLAIMIGPEGGLTDDEVALAHRSGWQSVSLGPRTLRVETAAAAALTLLLAALQEI
ncbi:hypothetical protein AMJ85_06170 [candidate division BRC1 bacterium SM23_51]|nr:MAG: hypothetical protein AMJ85_06170 [candidate division BRC1 bacterium SM23_51]